MIGPGINLLQVAVNQASGSFSPLSLFASDEEGAWYDPSDLTTLFQDAAGTVPVTADSEPVRLMRDKSGRNNHATAPSDAARPLYRTAGGLHWLQFDAVDDEMHTGVLIENKRTTLAYSYQNLTRTALMLASNAGEITPWAYAAQSGSATAAYVSGGTLHSIYIDNALGSYANRGALWTALVAGSRFIGDHSENPSAGLWTNLVFGKYEGGTFYAPEKVYGLIFRDGSITASERTGLDAYLSSRAGT